MIDDGVGSSCCNLACIETIMTYLPFSMTLHTRHIRLLNAVAVALTAIWIGVLGLNLDPTINDFDDYRSGALHLLRTGDPYNIAPTQDFLVSLTAEHFRSGYVHPPLLAYLLQPFVLLGEAESQYLWFAINAVVVLILAATVIRTGPDIARQYWGVTTMGIAIASPTRMALQSGNIAIIVAACVLGSFALSRRNPQVAGVLLGLAAMLKIYPAVLVVFYVLDPRRRLAAWYSLLGAMGMAGVVILTYDTTPFRNFASKALVLKDVYPYAADTNTSFTAFWGRLLTANPYVAPLWHAPLLAYILTALCCLAVLGLCLWYGRSPGSQNEANLAFGLWLCAMLLVSSVNTYHSLILLAWPVLVLIEVVRDHAPRLMLWLLVGVVLIGVAPGWVASIPELTAPLHSGVGAVLLVPSLYGMLILFGLIVVVLRKQRQV